MIKSTILRNQKDNKFIRAQLEAMNKEAYRIQNELSMHISKENTKNFDQIEEVRPLKDSYCISN